MCCAPCLRAAGDDHFLLQAMMAGTAFVAAAAAAC